MRNNVEEMNQVLSELNQKVLSNMEAKLHRYQMLAKYTKKTSKLRNHMQCIRFMEEVIEDYKNEYNIS